MQTQPPTGTTDRQDTPLQVGDFCHSILLKGDDPLFAKLLTGTGKILDITDGKFHIRMLTGEKIELSENESLIIKCSIEDFLTQAGYILESKKMKHAELLGSIFDAQKNITYDIPGAPTEKELNELKRKLGKTHQCIETLRKVYRELGILDNFQKISN